MREFLVTLVTPESGATTVRVYANSLAEAEQLVAAGQGPGVQVGGRPATAADAYSGAQPFNRPPAFAPPGVGPGNQDPFARPVSSMTPGQTFGVPDPRQQAIDDASGRGGPLFTGAVAADAGDTTFEESGYPFAAFLRGAGRAYPGLNVLQPRSVADRYARQGYDPAEASFRIGNVLEGFGDTGAGGLGFEGRAGRPLGFEDYSASRDVAGFRSKAADVLRELLRIGGGPASNVLSPAGLAFDALSDDPRVEAEKSRLLSQLGIGALSTKINPWALDLLNLPSGGDLVNEFAAQVGPQGTGRGRLDYFAKRYGLRQAGF